MFNKIKKVIKYLIFIVLGCILLITSVFFYFLAELDNLHHQELSKTMLEKKFDPTLWEQDMDDVRIEMYDDLIKNHLLVGMPWIKATKMLGTLYNDAHNEDGKLCYKYDLDYTGSFGMNTKFHLYVCPDQSNTIVKTIELRRIE
jgi:hypothetical protein